MDKKIIAIIILAILFSGSLFYINYFSHSNIETDSFTFFQEWSLSWEEGKLPEEKIFGRIDLNMCNEEKKNTDFDCFPKEISILPKQINFNSAYPKLLIEIKCVCWKK